MNHNSHGLQPRYLLGLDFDGTIARTFVPSPNNMTVARAYTLAARDVLGPMGEEIVSPQGMRVFRNQAPEELVSDVLGLFGGKHAPMMIDRARDFHANTVSEQANFVWDEDNPHRTVARLMTHQKLQYLMSEIGLMDREGNVWPPPTRNIIGFFQTVDELQQEGVPLDIAIISSGHEQFIRKTLDLYGVKPPDVLVTDDDVRDRKYPKEVHRRVKPGQLPLALAHQKWLQRQGVFDLGRESWVPMANDSKCRMAYIGDDPLKDGELSRIGLISGGWFGEGNEMYGQSAHSFNDWQVVSDILVRNKDMFDGRPVEDALFERSFPENELSGLILALQERNPRRTIDQINAGRSRGERV